ncbi:MAG: hypothetical protein H0V44_14155, partial [Planctomycetes bacterium]|nr:hypothetical protein [Planctomycetota bacterium]
PDARLAGERDEVNGRGAQGGRGAGAGADRGRRPDARPRPETHERPQRGQRPDSRPARSDRPDRRERPARGERSERPQPRDRSEGGRPERRDRPFRSDSDRGDRPERGERPERPERSTERKRPRSRTNDKGVIWHPGPEARVVRAEQGMKLAQFFVHVHKHLSGRAARRLLEEGCCRINGRIETFGSREIRLGEIIEFFLPHESHEHTFDRRRVLHDADGVIAYDKPAWLPVTPTEGPKSWSLLDILKPEFARDGRLLIPVHRLDADTSGIVLMATEERVARILEEQFHDHVVKKQYLALVRGHPRDTGSRRSYLVKVESRKGFEKWQSGRGADAREAVTTWTVEERIGSYASRVLVEPETGRYHQVRIHFSEMGHPLYGDRLYGDRQDPIHVSRHLLHASRVMLPNPKGGRDLDIRSRTPREFTEAEEQLRKL